MMTNYTVRSLEQYVVKAAFITILLFLISCSDRPKEVYIDTDLALREKLYMQAKPVIDSLTQAIMSLDAVQRDFDGNVEEIAMEDVLSEKVMNQIDEETPLDITLREDEFFIVHDSSNITRGAGHVHEGKHKIVVYVPSYYDNAKSYDEWIPQFWMQHTTGEFHGRIDSITQQRADEYRADFRKSYDHSRKAKYAVCINDLYYVKPKIINNKEFESGALISRVTVYRLADRKKVAETVTLSQNDDSVNSQGAHVVGDWAIEMRLREDLIRVRNKAIYDFLKPERTKKPDVKY